MREEEEGVRGDKGAGAEEACCVPCVLNASSPWKMVTQRCRSEGRAGGMCGVG